VTPDSPTTGTDTPAAHALPPISLRDLDESAGLLRRTDRKYVLDPRTFDQAVRALTGDARVLEIDGVKTFGYRSTYFDTPTLDLYHDAAHRRRHRFKVRIRNYVDAGFSMLEVKTKSGRDQTVKLRMPYEADGDGALSSEALAFVDDAVGGSPLTSRLLPVLVSEFDRTTVVDPSAGTRFTADVHLRCTDRQGRSVGLDQVILESKSGGSPSEIDRWLWAHHIRPTKISKYCTSMAALDPMLPANKWHRTLCDHFGRRRPVDTGLAALVRQV